MGPFLMSRRSLIAAASAYAVLQASFPLGRASAADLRVRENIEQFSQDPQKVAALRAAVKRMKDRSAANENDPLGWYYWSAVHGTTKEVPQSLGAVYE